MRRYWQEQRPPSMFSTGVLLRLMSGIGLLAVLLMLIVRTGDPNTWRWLVAEGDQPPRKLESAPPPLPEAAGPTDEDPDQAATAREEFQALTDGGLKLQRVEMEPYYRLVYWVQNQSFERLLRRARSDLIYTNFYDEPDKYRGRLVTMTLDVRRVLDAGKSREGVPMKELCGFTSNSWGRPYYLIVVDCPKGMPSGPSVNERVKFAGYFLKLQGYQPAEAKPGDPIEKAPLLIGRIEWKPPEAPPAQDKQGWIWGVGLLLIVGLALALRFLHVRLTHRRPSLLRGVAIAPSGEEISIESWLEQGDLNIDETGSNDDGDEPPRDENVLDAK